MPNTADVDRFLLIVEDDDSFARTLSRSFERRGWRVMRATGLDDMKALAGKVQELATDLHEEKEKSKKKDKEIDRLGRKMEGMNYTVVFSDIHEL